MEAQEIEKIVAALRCTGLSEKCDSCDYGYHLCRDSDCNDACDNERLDKDAAASIEALRKRLVSALTALHLANEKMGYYGIQPYTEADGDDMISDWVKTLVHEELEQQLPKRGKWIEDTTTYAGPGLSNYKCSLCGKICGTWRMGLKPSELPNWCGNCGADMRKMEVQDG